MTAALIGAALIGVTLGLLGSGGSILTVPVLVYLLGRPEKPAIAESLAIVGGIALVGAVPYALKRLLDWRSVGWFGIPGMAGAYGGAWVAKFVPGTAQLLAFALVMLLAAVMMFWRGRAPAQPREGRKPRLAWKMILDGLAVGLLTGFVGVGGGFLIVPALVLLGGLPMRLAVGTSLAIIAMKSASGFYKYLGVLDDLGLSVEWGTIALFIAVGAAGTFAGSALGARLNQALLKRVFAAFLVVMAVFIVARETPGLMRSAAPDTEQRDPAGARTMQGGRAPPGGTP